MRKVVLILVFFASVDTLEATNPSDIYYGNYMQNFFDAWNNFNLRLLHLQFQKNTSRSQAVAALPILCVFAQLSKHADGDNYRKLLKIFNARCTNEIEQNFMLLNEITRNYQTRENVYYLVVANRSHSFNRLFERSFASLCNDYTQNIDYGNGDYILNQWFKSKSNESQGVAANVNMLKNNGLVFGISFRFIVNLDHINNPKGSSLCPFKVSQNEEKLLPCLFGNAYIEYAYNSELDSQIIKMQFFNNEYYGIFIHPKDPANMPYVEYRLKNQTFFNRVISSVTPMCVYLKLTIGGAHTVNRLASIHSSLDFGLNNYRHVYENGVTRANVSDIVEEVHLSATRGNRSDVNSAKCGSGNYREVVVASAVMYHLKYKFGATVASGIFLGDEYGGDV